MTVTIRVDTKSLEAKLSALEKTQMPFALSLAVNLTGLDFQKAERERLGRVFTLRRPAFIEKQGVKRLGPAATKRNPSVTYGIDTKADFLTKFEEGKPKTPTRAQAIAMPQQVKRNKKDLITPSNRPKALIGRLGKKAGAGGVFVLKRRRGSLDPGIYQRILRGGRNLKMLFALEPKVKTPRVLQFEATFKSTVEKRFQINFTEAMRRALATAK